MRELNVDVAGQRATVLVRPSGRALAGAQQAETHLALSITLIGAYAYWFESSLKALASGL